ncbi:hypothetical protein A4X13_0g5030 [Tilletia indica]|uniref:Uncharacterized protein n=1 Tax=Tilletia indica TaxID=43049 RepID=A0A177TEM8_9BASI|nr:hypothetical protein A4X13_0g5030 [Tilletia indica]
MSAVRPHTRLASEVNPFERSFSDNPKDSPSKPGKNDSEPKSAGPSTRAAAAAASNTSSSSSSKADGASSSTTSTTRRNPERNRNNSANSVIPAATTPSKGIAAETPSSRPDYKPTLPPVASITSPSGDSSTASNFPWSTSLTGSLRAGPLSPAMLAGPQHAANNSNNSGQGSNSSSGPNASNSSGHNTNNNMGFDPQSFRTGFTPDLSNFRTGLTPLAGGPTSFPPPSPNTAAFLAMVTNGGNNSGVPPPSTGPTITPNTLAALTGAAGQGQGANNNNNHHGPNGNNYHNHHHQQHHNHYHSEGGNHNSDHFDIAFGRSFHGHDKQQGQQPSSRLRTSTRAGESSASVSPELVSMPLGPGRNGAGNANGDPVPGHGPNMAANGLFLLSQAHQMEMAKQDDPEAAAAAQALQGVSQIFTGQQPPPAAPGDPTWPGAIPGAPPGQQQHQQQQQQQQQEQQQQQPAGAAQDASDPTRPNGKAGGKAGAGASRAGKRKNSTANAKAIKKDAGALPALPVAKRAKTASSASSKQPGHNRRTSAANSLTGGSEDNFEAQFRAGEMDFGDFDVDDDDDDEGEDDGEGGKKKGRRPNKNGSHIDDEEKRKNFLERNRQAALKCRQRKKAWLASLQARVEYLTGDNEQLQTTVARQAQEIMYLKSALGKAQSVAVSHGIPATELQVPPINMNAMIHAAHHGHHHGHHHPQQPPIGIGVSAAGMPLAPPPPPGVSQGGPMIPPGVPIPSSMHAPQSAPNPVMHSQAAPNPVDVDS